MLTGLDLQIIIQDNFSLFILVVSTLWSMVSCLRTSEGVSLKHCANVTYKTGQKMLVMPHMIEGNLIKLLCFEFLKKAL